MRWQSGRRSSNVEDRRGMRIPGGAVGGGLGTIVMVLLALYFGMDPSVILDQTTQVETRVPYDTQPGARSSENDPLADFVSVILGDTEDTWHQLFRGLGRNYEEPSLVLFSGAVQSACGLAQSATGPFYCPLDQKVFIDLSFYRDLKNRFQSPGDFAQAYVIAHEVGHHIQTLLGISQKVNAARSRASEAEGNALSVRLELQADCLAGMWAHHADRARQILEAGDVDEALQAASSIGDDRLQKQSQGVVVPESFTHGSAEQRARWFKRGIENGDLAQCDTFAADEL